MSPHPGSMIARVRLGWSGEVRQMSAIGTHRLSRRVQRDFRCWSLTGTATAVPIFLSLTQSCPQKSHVPCSAWPRASVARRADERARPPDPASRSENSSAGCAVTISEGVFSRGAIWRRGALADRTAVINHGRIVVEGTTAVLRREISPPNGRADRHCSHPIPLRNEIVRTTDAWWPRPGF
jgi:hypothetical protein